MDKSVVVYSHIDILFRTKEKQPSEHWKHVGEMSVHIVTWKQPIKQATDGRFQPYDIQENQNSGDSEKVSGCQS